MAHLSSHHGIRFNQIKQAQLLSEDLLNSIDKDYRSFQQIAIELFSLYQRGEITKAITELKTLDVLYHSICQQLENIVFEPK